MSADSTNELDLAMPLEPLAAFHAATPPSPPPPSPPPAYVYSMSVLTVMLGGSQQQQATASSDDQQQRGVGLHFEHGGVGWLCDRAHVVCEKLTCTSRLCGAVAPAYAGDFAV